MQGGCRLTECSSIQAGGAVAEHGSQLASFVPLLPPETAYLQPPQAEQWEVDLGP